MEFTKDILLYLCFTLSLTYCIDVLIFEDPKDTPSESLKIGNISDDSYEVGENSHLYIMSEKCE